MAEGIFVVIRTGLIKAYVLVSHGQVVSVQHSTLQYSTWTTSYNLADFRHTMVCLIKKKLQNFKKTFKIFFFLNV